MEQMTPSETDKPTILIVDDEAGPRNALQVVLRPFFHLHAVENAQAALRLLNERRHAIDLVTLDLKLPDRSGVEVLQEIKLEHNELEVIIITGYGSLKSAMDGLRYGAAGYLLKPFNVTELISLIKQTLAKKQRLDRVRSSLFGRGAGLQESEPDLAGAWTRLSPHYAASTAMPPADQRSGQDFRAVGFLADVLEATDRDLFHHSNRASFYSTRLGSHLDLTGPELMSLKLGALFHDIGMVGAMRKPQGRSEPHSGDRLPEDSRQHTHLGARMMLPFQLPAEVGQVIVYHHERFDGCGYPEGLQGEGIPLHARIVSIAQEFDHIVSGRSSTGVISVEEALGQLRSRAGTCFDPKLVETFAGAMSEGAAAPSPFSTVLGPHAITGT